MLPKTEVETMSTPYLSGFEPAECTRDPQMKVSYEWPVSSLGGDEGWGFEGAGGGALMILHAIVM